MKILVIDNNTVHKNALAKSLLGDEVEVQIYKPGINFHDTDKDLIILSGGGGLGQEIDDYHKNDRLWYQDQMDYVLNANKPIIGICMGFEVICRAFGAEVEEMQFVIEGMRTITPTKHGSRLLKTDTLEHQKAHKWRVQTVSDQLQLLAESSNGVEMVMHQNRPILATQFHPETPHGTFSLKDYKRLILTANKT